MNLKRVFLLLQILLSYYCWAQQSQEVIHGTIFNDKNKNGVQDSNEKGISGIEVSNGETIVVTDCKGEFVLDMLPGWSVFPILPSNYTFSKGVVENSLFYYWDPSLSLVKTVKFGIHKTRVGNHFTVNAIGDVQVGNWEELNYASRSLFSELLAGSSMSTNLFLGDLVNNNLTLFSPLKQMISRLPMKSWTVIGNHDRDADTVRINQEVTYNNSWGASYYAFNKGNVHFIVLNNVYGTGMRSYKGRISERQLNFLKNDLKRVSLSKQLVICMHIPLFVTENRNELLSLLAGRGNVLVLSGHLHQVQRSITEGNGVTIHELVAGASCGFWWVGEKDQEGVPSALMQCGTPRNYFVFDFTKDSYTFHYKGIGKDSSKNMNIWVAGADSLSNSIRFLTPKKAGDVLITVYGGSLYTNVRCKIDGGEWVPCKHVEEMDPNVARIMTWNHLKVYPTKFSRLNPYRNRPSQQVWSIKLPTECKQGVHSLEVEAADKWGFTAKASRTFCIKF